MARMRKWRRHTVEFKRQAVTRMKACENIRDLARELGIQQKLLYTWKYQLEGRPEPRHASLAGVSRAGFYRGWEEKAPEEAELALRAAVQEAAVRHSRRYGYRRLLHDLRNNGIVIGKDRLQRIMREDNLLAIRHRKFILTT